MTFGATIALVSTAHCNRADRGGCHVVANVPGKAGFQFVIVDPATDTVYALHGGTTGAARKVDVINGATCNAGNTSNCHPMATVATGKFPIGETLDSAVHTLYVSNNYDNTVSLIDTANCNAVRTGGCGQTPPVVAVGKGPNVSALDRARHTLYVPNNGPGGSGGNTGQGGRTVSLIDTATCNAARQSGCRSPAPTATVGNTPATIHVGGVPIAVAVDQATDTVYVTNAGSNTISVINGATCNGTDHSGCGQIAATAPAGRGAFGLAVDQAAHKIIVASFADASVSLINGATCNATDTTGCGRTPVEKPTGSGPFWVAAYGPAGTAYVSVSNRNELAVICTGH